MCKIFYALFSLLLFSCNSNSNKDIALETQKNERLSKHLQDSLAFELCQMYGLDQGIREREIYSQIDKNLAVQIDSIHFVKLFEIIEKYGYPSKNLLGEANFDQACVGGASKVILLHNPYLLLSSKQKTKLLVKEADKGNLDREFIATVLDKYFWWKSGGKEVLYGSAFGMPCLSSKATTNILREEIGLSSLEDSHFLDCSKD